MFAAREESIDARSVLTQSFPSLFILNLLSFRQGKSLEICIGRLLDSVYENNVEIDPDQLNISAYK